MTIGLRAEPNDQFDERWRSYCTGGDGGAKEKVWGKTRRKQTEKNVFPLIAGVLLVESTSKPNPHVLD